jgi:uncharacterized C2H2 Zn-finger protein
MSDEEEKPKKVEENKVDVGAFVRCPNCGGVMRPTPATPYTLWSPREVLMCPDCGHIANQKESNWSYLVAILLAIIFLIIMVIAIAR